LVKLIQLKYFYGFLLPPGIIIIFLTFSLWVSNSQVLLAWGTSRLAQVFKLPLESPKGSHSLGCWNAVNLSDLFAVFLVLNTLLAIS